MIAIRPFVVSESLPSMAELTRAHWAETEWDVCGTGPKPSVEQYQAAEQANILVALAAYDDNEMVGYVTVFVAVHLHYGILYGAHDTLFVRSDLRGTLGVQLKAIAEDEAKARGALFVAWHAKPGTAFDKMLQAEHSKHAENIYIKRF